MLSDVNELSTIELVRNIENWIRSNQGIIVHNIHLSIDANCPVVIEDFSDMECSQPQPTVDPLVTLFSDTQSLTPAIAGAVGAVTVVALVIIVFFVLVAKKHKKHKRNIHVSRDSENKTR